MRQLYIRLIFCCCLVAPGLLGYSQDSTRKKATFRGLVRDVYKSFVVVEKKQEDSTFFQRSEEGFRPYAGKVIRYIYINNLSFGENVTDTARGIISSLNRIADRLQSNTRDYAVREMLFVRKGQLLDPFRLADNERFLRDQNFIKDARIRVLHVPGSSDSVDLVVRLKDVFSYGADVDASGINQFRASIYNANFLGMAQKLQYTLLYDRSRHPMFGSQVLYRKTSIAGTFVNVEAAYTTIDRGVSLGSENETATYLKLERPLYSPNAHIAGGLEVSSNQSTNVWGKIDSIFFDYKYQLKDVWVGYNMGVFKQKKEYKEDSRRREFVSVRYFDQHFLRRPQVPMFDARYTNKRYILAQYTWYKINFYNTNYIYGFGRTEDLPVGMVRKVTLGSVRTDSLQRIYVGWEFNHWLVDKYQNYWNYTTALGTNFYKKEFQDNSVFMNIAWYSRLFNFRRFRLRQYANVSYAGIYNQHVYEPLYINNEYGLNRFGTDSVRGKQRVTANAETSIYTRWQVLGFKIGFFAYGGASWMTPYNTAFKGGLYPAMGGGIRTRNENLIFGTIEARFNWFPHTVYNVNRIEIRVNSNLRVRFTGSFVQPPWFAMLR